MEKSNSIEKVTHFFILAYVQLYSVSNKYSNCLCSRNQSKSVVSWKNSTKFVIYKFKLELSYLSSQFIWVMYNWNVPSLFQFTDHFLYWMVIRRKYVCTWCYPLPGVHLYTCAVWLSLYMSAWFLKISNIVFYFHFPSLIFIPLAIVFFNCFNCF